MSHRKWTAPNLTLFPEYKSAASPIQSLIDDNLNLIYQALAFIPPAIFTALVFLEETKRWKKVSEDNFGESLNLSTFVKNSKKKEKNQ